MSGDFSPQTIEAGRGNGRIAPPALLIAVAIGLGTVDMPVPSIAEWGWTNWKFPRQVRAGETVYARWTLTQKRPAKVGDPTATAVWRVDLHSADGALCAEGEVGASVNRSGRAAIAVAAPAIAAAGTSRRRRGRKTPAKPLALAAETAPKAAEPDHAVPPAVQPAAQPEKTGGSRRRRRRRPKSAQGGNGAPAESSPAPPPALVEPTGGPLVPAARGQGASPLSRVIKRLRRPSGG